MRKAYSYLRFSTPEQSKGDSRRRQLELTREYTIRHKLDLDDNLTFHDLGISAFKGRNSDTGRLGDFLKAVRNGLVAKGSVLLVESLDRISRQSARKALRVLEDIVDEKVSVITLSDNREYTAENLNSDPTALLSAILIFIRANEESVLKSDRLKRSWSAKRMKISDKPLTSRGPAWLRYDFEIDRWIVIKDRKAIIERIFNEASQGIGEHSIAKGLNEDNIATWGDNGRNPAIMWHRSYIAKILRSSAVIGTLVPYTSVTEDGKSKRVPLNIVPGYYPLIIDLYLWEQVQALKSSRSPLRGSHSGQPIMNVLGGLARCYKCNSTMTRINKGSRQPVPQLICIKAKASAGCDCRPMALDVIEGALKMHFNHPRTPSQSKAVTDANRQAIDDNETEFKTVSDQIDSMMNDKELMIYDEAVNKVRSLLKRKQELSASKELQLGLFGLLTSGFYADRHNEICSLLKDDDFDKSKVNIALRQLYTTAVIDVDGLEMHLHSRFDVAVEIKLNVISTSDRLRLAVSSAVRDDKGKFTRH